MSISINYSTQKNIHSSVNHMQWMMHFCHPQSSCSRAINKRIFKMLSLTWTRSRVIWVHVCVYIFHINYLTEEMRCVREKKFKLRSSVVSFACKWKYQLGVNEFLRGDVSLKVVSIKLCHDVSVVWEIEYLLDFMGRSELKVGFSNEI